MSAHEAVESSSRHSALVVAQDPACARAIRDRLADRRFEVTLVPGLEPAVEALRLRPFDSLLIHLALPAKADRSNLFRAQMLAHRIPIVVLAGHPDEELGPQAIEAGVQEYLVMDGEAPEGGVPADLGRVLSNAVIRHRQVQRSRRAAARIASDDPVTGLADRTTFLRKLQDALAFAGRIREKPALLLLGLGEPGSIGERLGPALAPRLLCEIARRLTWCVRRADTLGRLDAEEIALLLPHAAGPQAIRVVAERIRLTASAPFASVRLRVSIGAAWYPQDGDTPDGLLRAAESALVEARGLGDGRCQLFRGYDLPPWPEDVVKGFRLSERSETGVGNGPAGALR
jgi:diguanylate cyclase (GGDEF)-like protein